MNARQIFIDGLWRQNTGLVILLGLCPLLAVTGTAVNGIGLGLATTLTLVCSNLAVSLSRRLLRPEIRIPAYVLIIASVVTTIQLLMQAWFHDLYRVLGIFIPLIVTNCAIIGRAEAFASRNPPLSSALDGLATGLGFCLTLVALGAFRELVGRGTLFSQAELLFGEIGRVAAAHGDSRPPGFPAGHTATRRVHRPRSADRRQKLAAKSAGCARRRAAAQAQPAAERAA